MGDLSSMAIESNHKEGMMLLGLGSDMFSVATAGHQYA